MPGFELFGNLERAGVQEVLDSGVLMRYGFEGMRNGHWKAKEMELSLARKMQVEHAHLVSSGTAALTVALASAGVGAGDEVILPTFTFVASFEAILALGAVPVLVDIDDTLTLDPNAVEKAIGPRTKVVMPVHMCGSMADLDALVQLCDRHGLLLLEDACQAIGGSYKGKALGTIGDLGCYSFDYVKTITCGEGGALVTDRRDFYENAHQFSDHGHDHQGNDRGAEEHPILGYNFRISELNAAVGLAQLSRLDEFIALQKRNHGLLKEAISQVPGLTFRRIPEGGEENYSFLTFFLPSEEKAQKAHAALGANGVDSCFYWYANNWHYHKKWDHLAQLKSLGQLPVEIRKALSDRPVTDFSASDHWMGRTVSALIKLGWSENEVAQRARAMVSALKGM